MFHFTENNPENPEKHILYQIVMYINAIKSHAHYLQLLLSKLFTSMSIQYSIDRPGVLSVVPGVRGMDDLNALLGFAEAPSEEKDYSVIGQFTPAEAMGNCVYCNHCLPCPAGIDVGLVNKYYDLP